MKIVANTLGVNVDVHLTLTEEQAREYMSNTGYDVSNLQARLVGDTWTFTQATSTKG